MQTQHDCGCKDKSRCCGKLTEAEFMMHEMRPERSVQEYHEILSLFEDAFDRVEEERERTLKE